MTVTKIANPSGGDGNIISPYQGIYRQAITNGNFDVWQRGNSFTGAGYTADGWYSVYGSSDTITSVDITGVTGIQKVLRWTHVNGTQFAVEQPLETVDIIKMRGKTFTFSFYARKGADSNLTSLQCNIHQGTGGEIKRGTGNFTNQTTTAVIATGISGTMVKYSGTFTVLETTTQMSFWFYGAHTGVNGGATDFVDIAQVQANIGTVALPFDPKPYAEELRLCQRYLRIWNNSLQKICTVFNYDGTTHFHGVIQLGVPMRIGPSVSTTGTISNIKVDINGSTRYLAGLVSSGSCTESVALTATASAAGTTGTCGWLYLGAAGLSIILSAEL